MTSSSVSTTPTRTPRMAATLMVALIIGVVAFQLNATMLNPAVKHMESELAATTAQISFTTAFFFLSKAIFQVFMPRLSDMVGRRKILIISLLVLALGTAVSMFAPNVGWLYVGRAIQGACGPVFSIALLVLREVARDDKDYGTKLGLIIAINGGVAGIDVVLGGWMADRFGFRSILLLTLIVTVLAIAAVQIWIPESVPSAGEKMDWMGVVLLAAFFVVLSWAVAGNPFMSLSSSVAVTTLIYAGIAVVALILFVIREKRAAHPLIPSSHLRNRAIWAMPLTTVLTLTSVMAVVNLVVPSFTQNPTAGWGMSAATASLLFMSPYALVGWIVGPFAGRIAGVVGYKRVLHMGLLSTALVLAALASIGMSNKIVFGILVILLGITYAGVTNVMLNGLGVMLSPAEAPGLLPGLNGASFGIGASLSFALLGRAITAGSPIGSSSTAGYHAALWISLGLIVLTFVVSLLLPTPQQGVSKAEA